MRLRHILLSLTAALAAWPSGFAHEPVRPVMSAWMAEAGTSHLADTYLSPVRYSGLHFGLTYSRRQAMKRTCLTQGWDAGVAFDRAQNPARNASMLGLRIEGSWRILRRWALPGGFQLGAGGYAGAEIGALYLGRNGNNPAQAVAAASIGPELSAQWRHDIFTLRLEASTPLLGAFFCPDYGELYYEIALGNRNGLAHFGWPGNRRRLRSMLSLDIRLGGTSLRLAYKFDATTAKANNIVSRRIEHSAVVGVVCDFITINPRKQFNDAQIFTAYY